MSTALYILAFLALLGGAGILSVAESAIHEIEAFILFLIGAVLLSGSAVVDAVKFLKPPPKKTVTPSQFQVCPKCGNERPASEKFCGECGYSLT